MSSPCGVDYRQLTVYTKYFTPPGANLLIEVLEEEALQNPLVEYLNPKTCYYAKVVWKKNLPNSNAEFGVGLRYLSSAPPES